MNTHLSSSQEALKEQYYAFAQIEVAPYAYSLESGKASLSTFLKKLGQAGYLGMTVPKEFGGQDAPFLNFIFFVEAISEFEPGLALSLSSHIAVIEVLKKYGSAAQKALYLPALASGKMIGAYALSEEDAGCDYDAVKTVLRKSGNKHNLLGRKSWVVNAQCAGLMMVLARRDSAQGNLEFALIEISKKKEIESIKISAKLGKLGLRSAVTNHVDFDGIEVSADNLLPVSENGDNSMLYGMDVAKVVISAAALGLLESCLKQAAEHANTRQQFGVNISQFQAIQWKLADLAVEATGARLQTYRAAWSKDEDQTNFHKYSSMCKWLSSKAARQHSGEALQILGAKGLSTDSPLERFYRDAKVMEIAQGTSELQKLFLVEELKI